MLLSALLLALPVPALAAPGDLDPSFDGDGLVLTDFGGFESAGALVLQPDGKLVAAGYSATIDGSGFALARYKPDGSLDRRFGDAGRVVTDLGRHDFPIALVLQPDGKLVLLGATTGARTTLVRYSPDGQLDASFGINGVVVTEARAAGALILQPDGKLVLGARPLARFNVDGTLDTSFGVGGFASTALPLSFTLRTGLALLPDGKLVAAGGNFAGTVQTHR